MEQRKQRTKSVALTGILIAMTMVGLLAASIVPNLTLSLTAMVGLCSAIAVCTMGMAGGFACYGVSAVLALLFLPNKTTAAFYTLLFGIYPVVKAPIEQMRNIKREWLIKLLLGNGLMACAYMLTAKLFGFRIAIAQGKSLAVVWVGLNVVFVVYDIACSRLLTAVQVRLLPILKQNHLI